MVERQCLWVGAQPCSAFPKGFLQSSVAAGLLSCVLAGKAVLPHMLRSSENRLNCSSKQGGTITSRKFMNSPCIYS